MLVRTHEDFSGKRQRLHEYLRWRPHYPCNPIGQSQAAEAAHAPIPSARFSPRKPTSFFCSKNIKNNRNTTAAVLRFLWTVGSLPHTRVQIVALSCCFTTGFARRTRMSAWSMLSAGGAKRPTAEGGHCTGMRARRADFARTTRSAISNSMWGALYFVAKSLL